MSLPLAHAAHDLIVAGTFLAPLLLLAGFYAVGARLVKLSDDDRDRARGARRAARSMRPEGRRGWRPR